MADPEFAARFAAARDYTDLFRLVKSLVERRLGKSRAGIMLGLSRLGLAPNGFLGGYFVVGSNAIVLNRDVLDHVRAKEPDYHLPYAFHVLLHEYLHTLGYFSEDAVRPLSFELSRDALGEDHPATLIAEAMLPGVAGGRAPALFRRLVYPEFGVVRPRPDMEIVRGFDPDATSYIM